jgi:hypothetical protein
LTDDAFTTFWLLWRKHMRKSDGRGKARPAWQQMIEAGVDPQDIIDGAAWYLRNLSERDAPYIPLAASWIRSERWADDCEQERAYQARLAERSTNVVQIKPQPAKSKFLQEWERKQAGVE